MSESRNVAVIDAANGTELQVTVRLEARGTALRGAYVTISSDTDLLLGRFSEIEMVNPVHASETFAPVIMRTGSIPNWSGDVDIERGKIQIMAVLDENKNRVAVRRNPSSGTAVALADQADISVFANEQQHFVVLGHIPNSGGLLASIVNRHFGSAADEHGNDLAGHGEARHIAILGQNGSGKTVLATMVVAGRLAAHPQMGLLMPDTSGDLCDASRHNRGSFRWNYQEALAARGVKVETIAIRDVRLTSPATLAHKLASPFLREHLSTTSDKAELLAKRVVDELFGDEDIDPSKLTGDAVYEAVMKLIPQCWSKQGVANIQQNAMNINRRKFNNELTPIRELFDGRWPLRDLIKGILERGRKIALTFGGVMDTDHKFVMREIIDKLKREAQHIFHGGRMANALVVLDEAPRWVPESSHDDENGIRDEVNDGFKTTRKYGLGWMVIGQSPASIMKGVLRECRTTFCGRNLGLGVDSEHLIDLLGKDGAQAYAQLAIQGGYYWVGRGIDANLGVGETWFALHPFGGDATKAFIEANPHIFGALRAAAAE
jgi:hypothetical protein